MICTLSKHEAERDGYTDSLMLDHEGNIAEATGANIFFKDKNGELHTPIPDSFLDGITRRTVIEIAKSKNIKINERKISPKELSTFVGCFLTGTAAEVTPIREIDGVIIGNGKRGPITEKLQSLFFDVVQGKQTVNADWLTKA